MKGSAILGIVLIGAGAIYLLTRGGEREKENTQSILKQLFPAGFTASGVQLDALIAAGYPQGSDIYQEAVDIAYASVARRCPAVGWSSALGYYCTTDFAWGEA